MSAGTLVLTNNSDVVSGAGTAFSTELVAGDFIVVTVGGITYTLPVKSVDSDTQITLISKYTGPAQSAVAWSAVPRETQNQVTAALVAQTTEALRGLNYDKANWQAVFSASGDITVILPDGSTYTGPSWNKIAVLLNSIDPDAIQALADQIHTDAQQVEEDRLDVNAKSMQVATDASTASSAATAANNANTAAQVAKENAAQSAQDAEDARAAIGDLQAAVDAVNGVATLPLGLPFWWFSRSNIPAGCVAYDGQELDQATYPTVYAAIVAGTLPVVSEAIWQSTPAKRNCFTPGSTSGKFRCPDMNGATTGSIAQIALTGGIASQEGIKKGEAPNIKGSLVSSTGGGVSATGALVQTTTPASTTIAGGSAATIRTGDINFDASKFNAGYSDAATDFHPARANGVICGQLFGRITNPGDVDGATLATRIETVNTNLLTSVSSTNSRISYALVDFGTVSVGTRTVKANPFGNNTPVICVAEIYGNGKWGEAGWIYTAANTVYGVNGGMVVGEGLVVQTAANYLCGDGYSVGGLIGNGFAPTSAPCRMHVFKVTA
ncbi:Tail fiber [Enterobacter sp. FY-07]|uniref:hypothetical protein n=1 Tax=Kosakonia oryzendophytica TaxID=1005665 RepID=UPI000777C962|nr:hypothetical protein [Kosakonia oryzendophytica]AMO48900.1 Tail fiber [Enterobacter sp. FY-07]WBT56596.1 hypothetical protein O9K67_15600 [Kosakonia oryzendophytica]